MACSHQSCLVCAALCPLPKGASGALGAATPGPQTRKLGFPPALWDDEASGTGLRAMRWGVRALGA